MVRQCMWQFGKTIFNILLCLFSKWRVLTKTNVTPYNHIIVYRNIKLYLLKTFHKIKQFTGQGVEKCNNDIKYHRKSNKHYKTRSLMQDLGELKLDLDE